VLPPIGSAHEQMLRQMFGIRVNELQPAVRVDNEHMIRHCVICGVGLGLWPEHAARVAEQRHAVLVAWDQRVTTGLVYAHVAERASDPLVTVLAEAVRAVWVGAGEGHLSNG
jgi:DNA-binding transcriptional LysR family regulator